MAITDKIENDSLAYWKEDGILFSSFKVPTIMTLDVIKTYIEMRHEISKGEKQYWCADLTNLKEYRKEARDYAEIHGQEYLYATAVVVHSHITMFIFNIFIKIKTPHIPFQAFKTKEAAVKWLKGLKNKGED
jgi:hypothetical protein